MNVGRQIGLSLAGVVTLLAILDERTALPREPDPPPPPPPPPGPRTLTEELRRAEIAALRAQVAREPGGIFAPVNRSREQARRVRQMQRLAAKKS